MESSEEILTKHYMEKYNYSQDRITAMREFKQIALDAMEEYADAKVKNLFKPDVKRSFAIRKVRVSKARFEKNGYGISVIDLSKHWKYLSMISIQLFFKTGLAILYELHEKEEQNCA